MLNKNLVEQYKRIIKAHYYVPQDNTEYLIKLSKQYISDKFININRIYLSRVHCDFCWVDKKRALFFPNNICDANPIFYNKYIKTNILLLEEIDFNKIFNGMGIQRGLENYYSKINHIPKEYIESYFDNEINNNNFEII